MTAASTPPYRQVADGASVFPPVAELVTGHRSSTQCEYERIYDCHANAERTCCRETTAGADGIVKPRLLDLFCCAGGASVGYHRAGFNIVGVDIEERPDYPFPLVVADALHVLWNVPVGYYDAIHASPPCQGYTTMANRYRGNGGPTDDHPQLIAEVRELLEATGLPYVIENVTGARPHMRAPITLTGGPFGLRVERPRLFESNVPLTAPPRRAVPRHQVLGIYGRSPDGRRLWTRSDGTVLRAARSLEEGAAAMGIDWMTTWRDVTEAIPPAYTQHIGQQLIDHIEARRAA